ncbi:hypothetical protein FRB93_006842 [Tulasnella sp. JGI-2019a]|nr:hypothetical protein FRB93_006842 [Tulasnella sp. JGI-2019a]
MYLISPWREHGDLSKFVSARLRFLGLSEDERARHRNRAAFEAFKGWDIIYGILSGLAYLHENKVIYGDMRAANVLLDTEIRPMLCDFGMTKVLDGTHNTTSTAMKGAGSLRWTSPEMLMNVPKSRESDIYASGMTIVEVITGKVPFLDIISSGAITFAIISGQHPALEPLSRDHTSFEDLWMLASSCWDHNTDKRPSAEDSLTMMATSAGARNESNTSPSPHNGGDCSTSSDGEWERIPSGHDSNVDERPQEQLLQQSEAQDTVQVQDQLLNQELTDLGQYRILLQDLVIDEAYIIGKGGFGVMAYGKLSGYPSPVAVKRLRSDEAQDIRVAKRLVREMKAWSKLRHSPPDRVLLEREFEHGPNCVPNPAQRKCERLSGASKPKRS